MIESNAILFVSNRFERIYRCTTGLSFLKYRLQ
jgi:hypothetical protein